MDMVDEIRRDEPLYINMDTIRFFSIDPKVFIDKDGKKIFMVKKLEVKKDE